MGLEAKKRQGGKLSARDEALLTDMKKKTPGGIKIYGETIDLSNGPAGLLEPLKNIATNPKVLGDVMQMAAKTGEGIKQAQDFFKDDGGKKAVENLFKIFQN